MIEVRECRGIHYVHDDWESTGFPGGRVIAVVVNGIVEFSEGLWPEEKGRVLRALEAAGVEVRGGGNES